MAEVLANQRAHACPGIGGAERDGSRGEHTLRFGPALSRGQAW
jgi:hypothetical protein